MFEKSVVVGGAVFSIVEGLCEARVSGTLVCGGEDFEKSIHIWRGRVASASSTLIDDRMGEIIYRKGFLSLDMFVEASGKVTKEVKFGEALIRSGVFTPLDLWDALHTQAREILASLCFYPKLTLTFNASDKPPLVEYPMHADLTTIFNRARTEHRMLERLRDLVQKQPELILELDCIAMTTNDFQRDMLAIIDKSRDFFQVVEKDSRLSREYSERAIFELYTLGMIRDTYNFGFAILGETVEHHFRETVEELNFMFAEMANAASLENIPDWPEIVRFADMGLQRIFGSGIFLHADRGFLPGNILRAVICGDTIRAVVAEKLEGERWYEPTREVIRETLFSAILQIHFELLNRKFRSPHFIAVKEVICRLRSQEA